MTLLRRTFDSLAEFYRWADAHEAKEIHVSRLDARYHGIIRCPTPAPCTKESHAAIKRDLETFRAGTTPIGMQNDLILGNCLRCRSSLAFELKPDSD